MTHKFINLSTAFPASLGTTNRIEAMRRRLAEERTLARSEDDYDAHVARKNAEQLEAAIETAERNERLHAERKQALQADWDAKATARRDAEQAKIEAELRRCCNLAAPKLVTEAEWEQVRESVLHRYRLRQMEQTDALIKQTAARYRI